jgi:hypothetical protein
VRPQYHFWPGNEGLDAWDVLIQAVDPSYLVILGSDGRVMDGMHRIARAMLEGRPTISAVRFEVDPEPDHRNCRPDDLPYSVGSSPPDEGHRRSRR